MYTKLTQTSPESEASLLSKLIFSWVGTLIRLGTARPLTQDDVWKLAQGNTAEHLCADLKRLMDHRTLLNSLLVLIRPLISTACGCALTGTALSFATPYFMFKFIASINASNGDEKLVSISPLLSLFVLSCVKALVDGHAYVQLTLDFTLAEEQACGCAQSCSP
jgi:hypothetical protein